MNYLGLILLVASIFVFGLQGMSAEMGIAVAASFVFLAFANLDKFSKFKGAGFEAEMKHVVDEAQATIENLKEVAKPLILTNIITLTKANRFSTGGFYALHELYDQLVTLQESIGLESVELERSKKEYLNIHAWDMITELARNIERAGMENFSITVNDALGRRGFEIRPSLEKLIDTIGHADLNEECSKQLSMLKAYYENIIFNKLIMIAAFGCCGVRLN
jgi:hypothetical protein